MRSKSSGIRCILVLTTCLLFGAGLAFAEPRVFFTDIVSGPNTGGEDGKGAYLSIFGNGFGATRGNSKVYINGTEVGAYKYWGPAQYANGCCGSTPGVLGLDQITIQPGPGVSSGQINVVVDGEPSNANHSFTVRPGDIYFVTYTGQDSKGTVGDINDPFSGIDDLYNANGIHSDSGFGAGDFMVLRGGSYLPRGNWDHFIRLDYGNNGTAEMPLTLMGYPGEDVIFDGTSDSEENAILFNGEGDDPTREGFVFANFKMKEIGDPVMRLGDRPHAMNHVRLVNVDLHAGTNGQVGTLSVRKSDYLEIYGVYIHDNFVEPGYGSKFTHQVYFSDGSHDVDVGWMEMARFDGGVSMSVRRSQDGPPWTVHYNMKFHNLVFHDQTSGAIVFGRSTGTNISFYNNLIYRTGKDLDLSDNAVNHQAGVEINDGWGPTGGGEADLVLDMYNNVIYDVGNENQNLGCYSLNEGTVNLHNNICVTLTPAPYGRMFDDNGIDRDLVHASNNLWWHPGGVERWSSTGSPESSPPSWLVGSTDVIADPLFVDPDALVPDFRLQGQSPAIDAGKSTSLFSDDWIGAPRPRDGDGNGSALFDIGAFEVQGESVIPFVSINVPTSASSYSTGEESITVGGIALDNVAVTGISWSSSTGASGTVPAGSTFSIAGIPLAVGGNVITVTAVDVDGNAGSDSIAVTRVVPPQAPEDVEVY